MLKIAICDDDESAINELSGIIEKTGKKHNIKFVVDDFSSGVALLEHIQKIDSRYDVIFLDIEMETMSGIETAREIRKQDEMVNIIYVTNYESFALEAYEVHPYHFIVKPISPDIIEKNLLKLHARFASDAYYEYQSKRDYYRLLVKDIMYFESNRRVVSIHLKDGNVYTYYDKLNVIEGKMKNVNAIFWRIHQSILVNFRYVTHKSHDHVRLTNGEILYISEDRRKSINAQYARIVEDEFIEY